MKTALILSLSLSLGGFVAAAAEGDPKPAVPPGRVDPLKKYDKNGDGKLDAEEKAAIQKDREAMRKEYMAQLLKKYDKNGNGKLDDDEQLARREDIRKEREAALARRQVERKNKEEKEQKQQKELKQEQKELKKEEKKSP